VTDDEQQATIVSIDGVGAFDHASRIGFFTEFLETDGLRDLLLFVCL